MLVEYIWLDSNNNPRSKTRVIKDKAELLNLPIWNYDGSSTGQAVGSDSEVLIKPGPIFKDPFRGDDNILVLCETYNSDMTPHITNTRHKAIQLFNKNLKLEPMFGIEQEFFLETNNTILGWYSPNNSKHIPTPQNNYYCGVGNSNAIGRECIEHAFKNCLYAGLSLTGLNAEVAPSQWEFQVCETGIVAADQLIMMRYILNRTAELHGLNINYHPKPITDGDWNGSGCHVNFSTQSMRDANGYPIILDAINKLKIKHDYHMLQYGADNHLRMTGLHETASFDKFSYGVANRGASVRIPRTTEANKCGYFEDRRPSSNMDPYIVTSLIFETCCLR